MKALKSRVKKTLKSEIEGNRFNLWLKQYLYYQDHKVNPSLTSYQDHLTKMIEDGVLVLEGFLEEKVVDRILDELYATMVQIENDQFKGKNFFERNPISGVYRIREVPSISETSKFFYDNPMIHSLAKAYVSKKVTPFIQLAELKRVQSGSDKNVRSISDIAHFDNWKFGFKAFLYLTDVGPNEAPFRYLKGSHTLAKGGGNFQKQLAFCKYGPHAGYYSDRQIEDLKIQHGFEETTCTGKRGTLILADTRGIHRGTPLRDNSRILLAQYFR